MALGFNHLICMFLLVKKAAMIYFGPVQRRLTRSARAGLSNFSHRLPPERDANYFARQEGTEFGKQSKPYRNVPAERSMVKNVFHVVLKEGGSNIWAKSLSP